MGFDHYGHDVAAPTLPAPQCSPLGYIHCWPAGSYGPCQCGQTTFPDPVRVALGLHSAEGQA